MACHGWRKASLPTVKEMKEYKKAQLDSNFPYNRKKKLSNDINPPKSKKELKRKLSRKDYKRRG